MSAEPIPSPWAQRFPRSVRLEPGGLFVSAGSLRVLLGGRQAIRLIQTGHALVPSVRDDDRVTVSRVVGPRPGDIVLVETAGWGDLRRLLRPGPDGMWVTVLDALPRGEEAVAADRILGVVVEKGGRPWRGSRVVCLLRVVHAQIAAAVHWLERVHRAPDFGTRAMASVARKYGQQVEGYGDILSDAMPAEVARMLLPRLPAGGAVLVAGSGAGGEAMALARAGYRVTGFDFVPAMVEAARRHAVRAGLSIEFTEAEMTTLDLRGRLFDAAYVTPLVHAFIPGRAGRIEALRRLGAHLRHDGAVLFSAAILRGLRRRAEVALAHARRRLARRPGEYGDWYTSFLAPDGTIDTSFIHWSRPRAVLGEIRAAGFAEAVWNRGSFFLAAGYERAGTGGRGTGTSASIAGQKVASLRKSR